MDTPRSWILINGRLRFRCPYGLRLAGGIISLGLFLCQTSFFCFQFLAEADAVKRDRDRLGQVENDADRTAELQPEDPGYQVVIASAFSRKLVAMADRENEVKTDTP
jgi:hypothetical protein